MGVARVESIASGERDVTLLLAAYVATINRAGLSREAAALNLIETLTLLIHENGFGCAHPATDIKGQNLYDGGGKSGCQIWALSWSQTLRTGASRLDAETTYPVPTALYLGCDPLTGPDHIEHYQRLTPSEQERQP